MYINSINRFFKKSHIEKLHEIPSEKDGPSMCSVQHNDKRVKY